MLKLSRFNETLSTEHKARFILIGAQKPPNRRNRQVRQAKKTKLPSNIASSENSESFLAVSALLGDLAVTFRNCQCTQSELLSKSTLIT